LNGDRAMYASTPSRRPDPHPLAAGLLADQPSWRAAWRRPRCAAPASRTKSPA
jgi:hypothetical protein